MVALRGAVSDPTFSRRISSLTFFNLWYSATHCSNVKLLTFGTFTVLIEPRGWLQAEEVEVPHRRFPAVLRGRAGAVRR